MLQQPRLCDLHALCMGSGHQLGHRRALHDPRRATRKAQAVDVGSERLQQVLVISTGTARLFTSQKRSSVLSEHNQISERLLVCIGNQFVCTLSERRSAGRCTAAGRSGYRQKRDDGHHQCWRTCKPRLPIAPGGGTLISVMPAHVQQEEPLLHSAAPLGTYAHGLRTAPCDAAV